MTKFSSFSMSLGGSVFVFLLFVLLGIAAAILFYRYTLPPLPPARRITLSTLRSVTLVLLLLILFEPVLRLVSSSTQPPAVAVLVDNTQSMTIRDGTGDRAALVRQFLTRSTFDGLSSGAVVKYFTFATKLKSATPASVRDSLRFTGEATDIASPLEEMKDRLPRDNVQAIVLVTDGDYTSGKNPLSDAEGMGIPMYTIGVGDTTEQKDVLVARIVTNDIAYAETRVPVDVTVKSAGYDGEKIEVTLTDGSIVIDRKLIALRSGTQSYPLRMTFEPKEEGTKKYTVSVSSLPGELTERNNAKSFFVKVIRSKLHVLLFAGAPNPDVAAIRQSLSEDEHFSVRSYIQRSPNEFYEGAPSRSDLDSADCIVTVGFPSSATSGSVIRELSTVIEQQKRPLLFIGGKSVDYAKLQTLGPALPFSWFATNSNEVMVFPSVADRQKSSSLATLGGSSSAESWDQLPPIYKSQTAFRAKPEAEVLASVKMNNVVLDEPLVCTRNINRQKSLAVTGYGLWRWRLLAQGSQQTENFLPRFLTNAVRWLTTKEENRNVRVAPTKEFFTTAEPIEFTGQVYDEQLRPVDDAELTVELSHRDGEKYQLALTSVGNGRYEGSLDPGVGEGDYTFSGRAIAAGGKSYGEDRGRFSVGQVNVEFTETRMNKPLLEQIAYRTGGRYHDVAEASTLLEHDLRMDAHFSPKELLQASEIELWNWRFLAGGIIALLALEWFIRKRSGML